MSVNSRTEVLYRIAIELQHLRLVAMKERLVSIAAFLELALNEVRAELARRGESPDPPVPSNDPKITRLR